MTAEAFARHLPAVVTRDDLAAMNDADQHGGDAAGLAAEHVAGRSPRLNQGSLWVDCGSAGSSRSGQTGGLDVGSGVVASLDWSGTPDTGAWYVGAVEYTGEPGYAGDGEYAGAPGYDRPG
jgi:hypothetical protein